MGTESSGGTEVGNYRMKTVWAFTRKVAEGLRTLRDLRSKRQPEQQLPRQHPGKVSPPPIPLNTEPPLGSSLKRPMSEQTRRHPEGGLRRNKTRAQAQHRRKSPKVMSHVPPDSSLEAEGKSYCVFRHNEEPRRFGRWRRLRAWDRIRSSRKWTGGDGSIFQ